MTVSVPNFINRFPSFKGSPLETLQDVLSVADAHTDPEFVEEIRDEAVFLRAADMLSVGPGGRSARSSKEKGSSTYKQQLVELQAIHALRHRG